MQQLEESVDRYLVDLERADRQASTVLPTRVAHLKDKIAKVREQMKTLDAIGQRLQSSEDRQVSLTDPDARSMATSGRGTGIVGYNVQTAVDAKHHMIVAHEVTNVGHDRDALAHMAKLARQATGRRDLIALADRGYFEGYEILECERAGIAAVVARQLPSNSAAVGRFDRRDFVYDDTRDEYRRRRAQALPLRRYGRPLPRSTQLASASRRAFAHTLDPKQPLAVSADS